MNCFYSLGADTHTHSDVRTKVISINQVHKGWHAPGLSSASFYHNLTDFAPTV